MVSTASLILTIVELLIESAKSNRGSKPIVRRLSARLDYQDVRIDLSNRTIRIILRDKWYILRIKHRDEYVKKFAGLK